MKRFIAVVGFIAMLSLAGCQPPAPSSGGGVAVIDLSAIAKATGQDEVIRDEAEAARAELQGQLQQLATNLEAQLQEEREKLGLPLSAANAERMQGLNMQAQQQINNAQAQAQQQAAAFEQSLVNGFRDRVRPLAEDIAKAKGASVVLADDDYLFWFESSVDITAEVIAAWRADPPETREDLEAEAAEIEAELEEVEEELEEAQEELEELQEAVEADQAEATP